jgi:hypothetical protein
MRPHPHAKIRWDQLVTALGMAAMVLALGLFALWPEAHARLHGLKPADTACEHAQGPHDHHEAPLADDAGCAITLFAHGVPAMEFAQLAPPPSLLARETIWTDDQGLKPPAADGLLPPAQGPPGARHA